MLSSLPLWTPVHSNGWVPSRLRLQPPLCLSMTLLSQCLSMPLPLLSEPISATPLHASHIRWPFALPVCGSSPPMATSFPCCLVVYSRNTPAWRKVCFEQYEGLANSALWCRGLQECDFLYELAIQCFFMTRNKGFNQLMGQPRTAYRLKHVFDQRVIWRGAPCSFGAAPRAAISATPGAAGRGAPNYILRCQLFSLQMLLGATTNI